MVNSGFPVWLGLYAGRLPDTFFQDQSFIHAQHARSAATREIFVMRGHEQRSALASQALKQIAKLRSARRIQRRRGLVHQ
jgi:hypothetical protein